MHSLTHHKQGQIDAQFQRMAAAVRTLRPPHVDFDDFRQTAVIQMMPF
jgi:hypothetical protein